MTEQGRILEELNDRSREVFRRVVEGYLETGAPVGSRTLTRSLTEKVSAATVRNVMQDLEFLGLLGSPHTSAGRVPTQMGLRMFVDGFLEVGDLDTQDRQSLDSTLDSNSADIQGVLDRVGSAFRRRRRAQASCSRRNTRRRSSISISCPCRPNRRWWCWCFPMAMSKTASSFRRRHHTQRHARGGEFPERASGGSDRFIAAPPHGAGDRDARREIDTLANSLIESGLAVWENAGQQTERLIVRGRSQPAERGGEEAEELDRIRQLFDDLERKRDIAEFLELTDTGRRCADLYRLGEQVILTFGFQSGRVSIYER
jgi:heat-inducible transcriptional repressor